jgi:VanZ family protein
MASSSMVFGVYAPQTSADGSEMLQAQLRAWLPMLACATLVALESSSYLGSDHTSAPLRRLAEALCGYGVDAHWGLIHHAIRKTGHFMGYGIFSLLCFRGFWLSLQSAASRMPRQLLAHGLAILATFLVASADEFHQSFLPNRCGQFSDVLLDTFGGVALCFLLFLAMQAVVWLKQARAKEVCRRKPACVEATA